MGTPVLNFITDDYRYKTEMYKDYKSEVKALNNKLDKLLINNKEFKKYGNDK